MKTKHSYSQFIIPVIFFLLYFFASGEDVPWIEIIFGSIFFSVIATFLSTLVYRFLTLLLNPAKFLNKQAIAVVVDEILEDREAKNN